MADVNSNLDSWSATEASNSPAGTVNIGTGLDDNLRQIQAVVRKYLATKGADIASAATTDLSTATGNRVDITGTVTITAFGTLTAGIWKILKFTGALTLTHNGTSLQLPGSANITTANGDFAMATSLGSGNWEVNWYQAKSGFAVSTAPFVDSTAIIKGSGDATKLLRIEVDGFTTATTRVVTPPDRDVSLGISLLTEQAATSGTSLDFTGIPSGVRRITVMFGGVSTSGTSSLLLQIGNGSVISTGYLSTVMQVAPSTSAGINSTAGFAITNLETATAICYGSIVLTLENATANTWVSAGKLLVNAGGNITCDTSGGYVSLAGVIDRVRITTVAGTNTFDAGVINISYEF